MTVADTFGTSNPSDRTPHPGGDFALPAAIRRRPGRSAACPTRHWPLWWER